MFLWIFCFILGLLTIMSIFFLLLAANYTMNQVASPNVSKVFEYIIIVLIALGFLAAVSYFPTIFYHHLFFR